MLTKHCDKPTLFLHWRLGCCFRLCCLLLHATCCCCSWCKFLPGQPTLVWFWCCSQMSNYFLPLLLSSSNLCVRPKLAHADTKKWEFTVDQKQPCEITVQCLQRVMIGITDQWDLSEHCLMMPCTSCHGNFDVGLSRFPILRYQVVANVQKWHRYLLFLGTVNTGYIILPSVGRVDSCWEIYTHVSLRTCLVSERLQSNSRSVIMCHVSFSDQSSWKSSIVEIRSYWCWLMLWQTYFDMVLLPRKPSSY